MKKIRTILAYYNGEKFIDEQLQSIVDQEIPEGYEHEIYVYDDGSKKESLEYLVNKWGKIANIKIDGKNAGIFERYTLAVLDAIDENVEFLFLADQDDVFEKNKYSLHLFEHKNSQTSIVCSHGRQWFWEEDRYVDEGKYGTAGHRMSLNLANTQAIDRNKFHEFVLKNKNSEFAKIFHDTFIFHVFSQLGEVKYIPEVLNNHRVHSESQTNNGNKENKLISILKNENDYLLYFVKPFFIEVFSRKLTISELNKTYHKMENYDFRSLIKWKIDNFSMYVKSKFLRNIWTKIFK